MAVAVRAHRFEEGEFRPAGGRRAAGERGGNLAAQRVRLRRIQAGAVQADQRSGGAAEQAASSCVSVYWFNEYVAIKSGKSNTALFVFS